VDRMLLRSVLIGVVGGLAGSAFYFAFVLPKELEENPDIIYGNVDIRQADLSFRVFGRIDTLKVDEGDRVKAGDLLAILDKKPYEDKVAVAKATLNQNEAAYNNAQSISERKRKLASSKFASTEDYETAKAAADEARAQIHSAEAALSSAQTDLSDTEVVSPSDGTIISRVQEKGTIVNAGQTVFVLSLDNPMWVRAYIPEPYLGRIKLGMKAHVFTDSRPDKPYTGQVGFVSPVAEFTPKNVETPELRTQLVYRLRIIITDADAYLRQGMPVTVKFLQG